MPSSGREKLVINTAVTNSDVEQSPTYSLRARSPSRGSQDSLSPIDERRERPLIRRLHTPTYPPRNPTFSSAALRSKFRVGLPPVVGRFVTSPTILVLLVVSGVLGTLLYVRPGIKANITLLPTSWTAPTSQGLPTLPDTYEEYFPSKTLPTPLLVPSLAPLALRLNNFLLRPARSYADAIDDNRASCPTEVNDLLVNPDQYRGDGEFWREEVTPEVIVEKRASLVSYLVKHSLAGERILGSESMGGGRGIVLTGGNQDTTLRMITVLRTLKRHGVTLPIEVFHYEDELHDQEHRRTITELGASIRQIRDVHKVGGVWKNWQIKGLAIVQSSFREVLYLDSDNTPLRDPSHLFDSPRYTDMGRAVFWPDLSKDHPDNAIWRIVGDDCSLRDWTFESGQMVIDKAGNGGLNLAALWLASGMMEDREFWFKMCGGDKDTFRWAWRMLDIPFGTSPRWMSTVGTRNQFEDGRFCGHSVLQYDLDIPEGMTEYPPLFVHSNLLKHMGNGGLNRGSLFTHVKRMSIDLYSEPSLNYAHSWVYMGAARGMCLDLDWHPLAYERLSDEERERQFVMEEPVEEVEGRPFAGFEEGWFDDGGRIGGW